VKKKLQKGMKFTYYLPKIKSEAMFVDMDDKLDGLRRYQNNLLKLFYEIIEGDTLNETEFKSLLETPTVKHFKILLIVLYVNVKPYWIGKYNPL
jgi:hypothetical protein